MYGKGTKLKFTKKVGVENCEKTIVIRSIKYTRKYQSKESEKRVVGKGETDLYNWNFFSKFF